MEIAAQWHVCVASLSIYLPFQRAAVLSKHLCLDPIWRSLSGTAWCLPGWGKRLGVMVSRSSGFASGYFLYNSLSSVNISTFSGIFAWILAGCVQLWHSEGWSRELPERNTSIASPWTPPRAPAGSSGQMSWQGKQRGTCNITGQIIFSGNWKIHIQMQKKRKPKHFRIHPSLLPSSNRERQKTSWKRECFLLAILVTMFSKYFPWRLCFHVELNF